MPFTPFTYKFIRRQAVKWLVARQSGNWTRGDEARLKEWLDQNTLHRQAFEEAISMWDRLGQAVSDDALRTAPSRSLGSQNQRLRLSLKRWITPTMVFLTWSAVFVLLLVAPWWNGIPHVYSTLRGEQKLITLEDGSKIALNADSQLIARIGYAHRTVLMQNGEALFTIIHDPFRPFEVHTGNHIVRDMGTTFNIEYRHNQISLAVLEGLVSISTAHPNLKLADLGSGKGVSYDDQGNLSPVAHVQVDEVIAWRDWKLVFRNQPLAEALDRLAPYHDVMFDLADPKLARIRISGSFRIKDLNLFLKTLETAFPIRAKVLDPHHVRLQPLPQVS